MQIIIETFLARGESSGSDVRARPLPGQGMPTTWRVECSKSMRDLHPIGTLFKVWAKITNRLGGNPFVYTNYRDPYEVVTPGEARAFINRNKTRARAKS